MTQDPELSPGARWLAQAPRDPLRKAAGIMELLRGPGGCPWDREQTFESLQRHTLEETYEVFDAIDRRDWPALKDELGDLLLQVLFYAEIASEAELFNLDSVAETLSAKLIRRHPHVFGNTVVTGSAEVLRNWEQIKREEKAVQGGVVANSLLADVPKSTPALVEAAKLGSRAAKVGFDWPHPEGVLAKLHEEVSEFEAEVARDERDRAAIEEELGDLLFTAAHLARHLGVDPEMALRRSSTKFRRRFAAMEAAAGGAEAIAASSPEHLDALWVTAKHHTAERVE